MYLGDNRGIEPSKAMFHLKLLCHFIKDLKMLKTLLAKAAARLKEPSTHAALMGLAGAAGFVVDAGLIQSALIGLSGLFGVLAVVLPEGK